MDFLSLMALSGPPAWVVTAFLGLVFGSFASAMAYRIPRDVSWVSARSACTSCGHVLSALDLVPFFSWMFLRGRCRHCRAAICWRYPMIELCTLLACLLVQGMMGFHLASIILMMAMPFLVAMIAIDIEFMILPDQINIILGVLGAVFVVLTSPYAPFLALKYAVLGAALYAGLVFVVGWVLGRVLKKEALGLGDVKFFAVAGVWLGVGLLPAFLILSGVCGVIMGAFWKVILKKDVFPFGPALIVSFVLCVLFQGQIQGVFDHFM